MTKSKQESSMKRRLIYHLQGGAGTTLLIAIAIGAITIGTAAVVIDKNVKQTKRSSEGKNEVT